MQKKILYLSVIAFEVCVMGLDCTAQAQPYQTQHFVVTNRHELVRALARTIHKIYGGGRVYYETSCVAKKGNLAAPPLTISFPRIQVGTHGVVGSDYVGIVNKFHTNDKLSIKVNRDGLITFTIGDIDRRILQTRIMNMKLNASAQYTANEAIYELVNSKYVKKTGGKLGVALLREPMHFGVQMPATGLPHLPGNINNLTLDQALDLVAKTFHGVVFYGVCEKYHTYIVNFVDTRY